MTFKTGTVTQRMAVRDSSYKLGKLAELLTLGHGPIESGLGTQIDTLATQMLAALGAVGYEQPLQDNEAKIDAGDGVSVYNGASGTTSYPAVVTVDKNEVERVNLTTATQAVAADGDAVSIQDRSSNTLLGSGVLARVAGNRLVAAYFSSLTYAISSDGNPMDVTTARGGSTIAGRVRLYVSNNTLRNVYLESTAALQTGATVPVQNSAGLNIDSGTVTVTNNLVASVKLPATTTAFKNGVSHTIVDRAGNSAQAVANVANGSLTNETLAATAALLLNSSTLAVKDGAGKSADAAVAVAAGAPTVTLPGTNAIVADEQTIAVDGGTVTLSVADGVLTATYTAS